MKIVKKLIRIQMSNIIVNYRYWNPLIIIRMRLGIEHIFFIEVTTYQCSNYLLVQIFNQMISF